jgi:hypothetical protein
MSEGDAVMAIQTSVAKDLAFDFVVVGGGLAGICAAISAARLGGRTALIQDRPVLGGNSSSEVKVPPVGAGSFNAWAVETGIAAELTLEERYRNHERIFIGSTNSIWDLVLLEWVQAEPNLSLFLNTSVRSAEIDDYGRLTSVDAVQLGSERALRFLGKLFCDASGDGVVAYSAGADFRYGREGHGDLGEPSAPIVGDSQTLPSSLLFRSRDMGRPVPFRPPKFAERYDDESFFDRRRRHRFLEAGYTWVELAYPMHTVTDNDAIRDELLKRVLGVWDHIKNHCVNRKRAKNWVLEWVGSVVGKRESRRFEGDYWLREQDLRRGRRFKDAVAYGGWYLDYTNQHHALGLLASREERDEHIDQHCLMPHTAVKPYTISYRCMYAKKVPNLFLAGRIMSFSHIALGSARNQLTLAVCGQAVGTAAALCLRHDVLPRELGQNRIVELQKQLLRDDCYIPGIAVDNPDDLAQLATTTATSEASLRLVHQVVPAVPTEAVPGYAPMYDAGRVENGDEHKLTVGAAQLVPISMDRVESVTVPLRSELGKPVALRMGLRPARDCWDLDSTDDIASATAVIEARGRDQVRFELGARVDPERYYWIYIDAAPGVFWADAFVIPIGCVSAWETDFQSSYYAHTSRRFARQLILEPESRPYGAENVTRGGGHPDTWTNCWVSDPDQPLPQSVTLSWEDPVDFDTVQILYDINLDRHYWQRPAVSAAPECVRDYTLQAEVDGEWQELVRVEGNIHRRREHTFSTVSARHLRLTVTATNGGPEARVYKIGVYNEGSNAESTG